MREPSRRHAGLVLAGVLGLLGALPERAVRADHPISVIQTDAYVSRTKVNLRMRMFAEDLVLFQELYPNEVGQYQPEDIEWAIDEHKDFLLERVIVRDAEGEPLPGRIVNLERFEIPDEGIPDGAMMEYTLTYHLEFDLVEVPEFLTFTQEIVDANFVIPSEMQLHLKQSGSEAVYQTALRPNEPYTARFDWDSPPLSPDADEQAWEDWFAEQREQTLGITSYSSVYSFVYITNFEVRHEILIPLVTLASIFDIERADSSFLEVDEQDRAKPLIEAFFRQGNPLQIDQIEVTPVVDRIDFYGLEFRDFAIQAERRRVSMASGRVGVILSYPAKTPPDEVKLTWDLFPPNVVSVESIIFAYDDLLRARFSKFNENEEEGNTFVWHPGDRPPPPSILRVSDLIPDRPQMRVPVISVGALLLALPLAGVLRWGRMSAARVGLIVVGWLVLGALCWPLVGRTIDHPFREAKPVPEADAEQVFKRLHANTYRAFDYRQESEIYDALAASVDGELLRELYLDIRAGLEEQSQGGAVATVAEVEIVEGTIAEQRQSSPPWPGFDFQCTWTVRGTIEHWGHIHERTTEYTGRFSIQPRDDSWKITGMELLGERPISVIPSRPRF